MVGINTIMYYGPKIILATGISLGGRSPNDPQTGIILNIPLAFINALGTGIATLVLDNFGRRFIMLRTLPGVLVSLIIVATGFYLTIYTENMKGVGNAFSLIGMVVYLGFFSIGMSSSVWSVNTEIYPLQLIGTATSLSTATNWLSNFVVSSVFLIIMEPDIGKILAFLILSVFTIWAYYFIYYRVPETKGKSITENVDNILKGKIK